MKRDDDADRRFDELLRDIGPDVPQPMLSEPARARFLASIDQARVGRSLRWMNGVATAATSLAAVLAVACVVLWASRGRVEDQLVTSRWETDEVLQLLMNARRTQPSIPVPENLDGVTSADLVLITFDHELCPLARVCTPRFEEMARRHRADPARFMTFDVTGAKRDAVAREIDAAGLEYALFGPPGAETGVVKVLDTTRDRVLCSAPGEQGLAQAELLLARLSHSERRP